MQITISDTPVGIEHQSVFLVKMDTYFGDMDGQESFEFEVASTNIVRTLIEIGILEFQFPNGRGGCRRMYDQKAYFNEYFGQEDVEGNPIDEPDGNFDWVDDLPYNGDYEQNHSINGVEVFWYNEDGTKFNVTYTLPQTLADDVKALNKAHKVGDFDHWDEQLQYNHPGYYAERDKLTKQYQSYRADAVKLVQKHVEAYR